MAAHSHGEEHEVSQQLTDAQRQAHERLSATHSLDGSARLAASMEQARQQGRDRIFDTGADLERARQLLGQFAAGNPQLRTESPDARASLGERIDRFVDAQRGHLQESEARAGKVIDLLTSAQTELSRQQQQEMQAAPMQERAAIESRHAAQNASFAELAGRVVNTLHEARARDDSMLKSERQALAAALSSRPLTDISEALAGAREQAAQAAGAPASKHADLNALASAVVRSAAEIRAAPDARELREIRAALGALGKDLDEAALGRIAMAEGVNAIKGQLFEELVTTAPRVQEMLAEAQRELAERGIRAQAQFIAGDRIRDDSGYRKLTDGMVVFRDEQDRLHVLRALEAKAGQFSGDKLVELTDRRTRAGDQEIAAYARDVVRDLLARQQITPQQAPQYEADLRDWLGALSEAGQARRTLERLTTSDDYASRIYVDGRRQDLATQGAVRVDTVTPRDVSVAGLKEDASPAERLEHERQSLDRTFRDSRKLEDVSQNDLEEAARRLQERREEKERNRGLGR